MARIWKQSGCPSSCEGINKLMCIHMLPVNDKKECSPTNPHHNMNKTQTGFAK